MVAEDLRPSAILTAEALRNAVRTVAAVGGSTNAVVHLLAIARRVGAPVTLADIDRAGRGIPLLADIQPAGAYLMEDFHRAGGLDAVLGADPRPPGAEPDRRGRPAHRADLRPAAQRHAR